MRGRGFEQQIVGERDQHAGGDSKSQPQPQIARADDQTRQETKKR
jgi:hypothetical protein